MNSLGIGVLGLLVASLWQAEKPTVDANLATLAGVAWVVNLLSPRTPVGVFPAASSFYLLLLLLVGPAVAALCACFGLLLWALVNSGHQLEKEVRLGLLPLLTTVVVSKYFLAEASQLLAVSATCFFYLMMLNMCATWQAGQATGGLAWDELRWAFLRSSMVVPLLSAMGVVLVPHSWLWGVGLGTLAWFQSGGAVTELLRSQVAPMNQELKNVRGREQKWRERLSLLDRLSKQLAKASEVRVAVRGIEDTVRSYCEPEHVKVHLGAKEPTENPCFALAGVGFLEVKGELSEEQRGLLSALSTTAGFALRTVRAREQKLQSVTQERDQMEAWLERLRVLLQASQSLASSLSMDSVLDTSESILERLLPQEGRVVLSVSPQKLRQNLDAEPHQAALQRALQSGRSEIESTRLVIPVMFEGVARGAILLTGSEFSGLDIELVKILAYQLGGAFERARLYEQIVAAEAQVLQSSKMSAIGQLAAGLAHELNTPLSTVLMSLEDAAQKLPEEPQKALSRIGQAEKSGKKAQDIIAKLLHYSREATLEDQEVDLRSVVEYVAESLRYQLKQSKMKLELDLLGEPKVRGNENELHQVVSSLVTNSLEALSTGDFPPVVKCELSVGDDGARICVSDAGPGMAPEVQKRIFEPFFTTRQRGVGTGLGLSTALQIVEKHGGELRFETQPGQTKFFVTLPLLSGA